MSLLPSDYRPAIQFEIAFDATCLDAFLPRPALEYTSQRKREDDRQEVWQKQGQAWITAYDHSAHRWSNLHLDAGQVTFGDVVHVNNSYAIYVQGGRWLFATYNDNWELVIPYDPYLLAGNGTPFPFDHWKNTDLKDTCRASPGYLANITLEVVRRFGSIDDFNSATLRDHPLDFYADDHGRKVEFAVENGHCCKTLHALLHDIATDTEYGDSRMLCGVEEGANGKVKVVFW